VTPHPPDAPRSGRGAQARGTGPDAGAQEAAAREAAAEERRQEDESREQERRELELREQERRERRRQEEERRAQEQREARRQEAARRAARREESRRRAAERRAAREAARRARRAAPAARRRSVRDRGLWAWFIPESRRMGLAILVALLAVFALRPLPAFDGLGSVTFGADRSIGDLSALGLLFIAVTTLYSLATTALMHWVGSHLDRRELRVIARLSRARHSVGWYRWVWGSTGARSEAAQMLVTCAVAVLVLLTRPESVPVVIPLLFTAGAVVAAWLSSVVGFAAEYAAEDSHGTGLHMPGIPPAERGYEEYLDLAVLVQTTSGPPGVVGTTRPARRALRSQSILAHVMSTVIISLAVSVVLTSLT